MKKILSVSNCLESSGIKDYSVAKGGKLVAYRHDGERVLDGGRLVYV
jgi:hypothetical protein